MKLEWGKKRACSACGLSFYDMMQKVLTCPNCGNVFEIVDPVHKQQAQNIIFEKLDIDDKIVDINSMNFSDEINVSDLATTTDFEDSKGDDEK